MIVLSPISAETAAAIARIQEQFRAEAAAAEVLAALSIVLPSDSEREDTRRLQPTAPRNVTVRDSDLKNCLLVFDVDGTMWNGEDEKKPFPGVRLLIRALYEFGFTLAVGTFNVLADTYLLRPWGLLKYFSGFSSTVKGGKPRSVARLQALLAPTSVAVLFDDCWINELEFNEDDHPQRHMVLVNEAHGVTAREVLHGIEVTFTRLGKREVFDEFHEDLAQALGHSCLVI